MSSVIPQWLQDLNTALSLLGFLITLYVLFEVKRIKASFKARARLPDLIRELGRAGSALSASLDQWPSQRHEAFGQVKIAATLLGSTLEIVSATDRKELKRVKAKLSKAGKGYLLRPQSTPADTMWDLYSDVQSCLTSLTQISKNKKWE